MTPFNLTTPTCSDCKQIYTYLLGSRRGSGCNQAANLAPDEPGAPLIKSFKNWRSLDCELERSHSLVIAIKLCYMTSGYATTSTKAGALNAHQKLMYTFLIKLNSNPKSIESFATAYAPILSTHFCHLNGRLFRPVAENPGGRESMKSWKSLE
uniref:Uncharacterized protein n=1 Tax=Glossina pallidipes TaxID=7398 RepID=A0A1A9ZC33_GLOPL